MMRQEANPHLGEIVVEKWSPCGVLLRTREATAEEAQEIRAVREQCKSRVTRLSATATLGFSLFVAMIAIAIWIVSITGTVIFMSIFSLYIAGTLAVAISLPRLVMESLVLSRLTKDDPNGLVEEYKENVELKTHRDWLQDHLGGGHVMAGIWGGVTVTTERSGLILHRGDTGRPSFLRRRTVPFVKCFSPSGPVIDEAITVVASDAKENTVEVVIIPRLLHDQERTLLEQVRREHIRNLAIFTGFSALASLHAAGLGAIGFLIVVVFVLYARRRGLADQFSLARAIGVTLKENRLTAVVPALSATETVEGRLSLRGRETLLEQLALGWLWRIGPMPILAASDSDACAEAMPNPPPSRR